MRKATYGLFIALVVIGASNVTAATDPFAGKWELDVLRSKYRSGTCPKSMVIEMEAVGKGIRYRSDTTYANGSRTHSEYAADYDGNQAIVAGAHGLMLPVFLKRIDSHTVIASYTKNLHVVATSRRVVSEDGRLMTITTTSTDESGKRVTTIGIYKKQ